MSEKAFMRCISWSENKLTDWNFCNELWSDMTKESEDWDLGGKFNYVYHRYNQSFKNHLIHMLYNTPTYRDIIFSKLSIKYMKEHEDNDFFIYFRRLSLDLNQYLLDNWNK